MAAGRRSGSSTSPSAGMQPTGGTRPPEVRRLAPPAPPTIAPCDTRLLGRETKEEEESSWRTPPLKATQGLHEYAS